MTEKDIYCDIYYMAKQYNAQYIADFALTKIRAINELEEKNTILIDNKED